MQEKIIIYGATWCPDCRRAKQFFGEHRIPYEWIDITDNDEAIAYIEKVNNGNRSIPTIIFPDGDIMVEPSNAELAEKTGAIRNPQSSYYDVIIIGGGPAGLTAAIYTAREGLNTLIIDGSTVGGQAATTQVLDNFPGFPEGVSGEELATRMEQQARRFDVDIVTGEYVADIVGEDQYIIVKAVSGDEFTGRSVLITTGSHYRNLDIPGEKALIGKNIHFCATCDGAFYKDKDVLVIGGGNSGFEEGLFLADQFAKSVTIVEFLPEVKASQILQNKVADQDNMQVFTNRAVKSFNVGDDGKMASVTIEDRATGETAEWHPDGVFVFIGLTPNSDFLPEGIARDDWGFVKADDTLQTTMPGVFVAGDVRAGSTKQAVSAAGEGATAALMIRQYLQKLGDVNPVNAIERETIAVGS